MEFFDFPIKFVTCDPIIVDDKSYLGYAVGIDPCTPPEPRFARLIYALMMGSAGSVCEWRRGTMERGAFDPGDYKNIEPILNGLDFSETATVSMLACTEEFLRGLGMSSNKYQMN